MATGKRRSGALERFPENSHAAGRSVSRRKIAQFIDDAPESLFVPTDQVLAQAAASGAIPYDVPGVELTHEGPLSSFDAIDRKSTRLNSSHT